MPLPEKDLPTLKRSYSIASPPGRSRRVRHRGDARRDGEGLAVAARDRRRDGVVVHRTSGLLHAPGGEGGPPSLADRDGYRSHPHAQHDRRRPRRGLDGAAVGPFWRAHRGGPALCRRAARAKRAPRERPPRGHPFAAARPLGRAPRVRADARPRSVGGAGKCVGRKAARVHLRAAADGGLGAKSSFARRWGYRGSRCTGRGTTEDEGREAGRRRRRCFLALPSGSDENRAEPVSVAPKERRLGCVDPLALVGVFSLLRAASVSVSGLAVERSPYLGVPRLDLHFRRAVTSAVCGKACTGIRGFDSSRRLHSDDTG